MRHKFLGIVVVLMITAMATGAWAKAITVEEEDLAVLAGQAGGHFHKARENFLKGYIAAAADEIRVGNAYMKLEHARATGEGKKTLKASIDELAELANKVEMNTVEDAIALDEVFARANHALASHRYLKAQEYHEKGEDEKAAFELKAAASNIERGFGWAGQKMEAGTVAAIRGTRLLAGKAIQAPGWVISKSGKALAAVGRGTGRFIGAIGRGTGRAVGAVGDAAAGVGRGSGEVVKGVGSATGKAVEGVTGGVGEGIQAVGEETKTAPVVGEAGKAVGAVGKGTGDVVKGVTEGAGTAVEAVGEGTGKVVKGVGWVPEQVGNSISGIGKAIQKLGKAVEPKKK